LPLTFAINSLNRCIGLPDLYPFILGPEVIRKLGFIHDLVRAGRSEEAQDKLNGAGSRHEEKASLRRLWPDRVGVRRGDSRSGVT
jgi:Putative zinc-binding metallo-peptidase